MSNSQQKQASETHDFQTNLAPAAGWAKVVTDNFKVIGLVLAAVIVIAALFSGYSYYKTQTLRNAKQRVDQIMSENSGQERIQALEAFVPQAPKTMQTALHLQLAKLCMQEEEFTQGAAHWEYIEKNSSDQDLQTVAALGQAAAFAAMDRTQEALKLLQATLEKAPKRYSRTLTMKLATVAEKAGQWEQALNAYQTLADMEALPAQPDEFIEHKIKAIQNKMHTSDT
jgi:predicted negative regulator of RcsB-dependent stress response